MVKGWLLQLPAQYHQRAHNLFNRHGLAALLIGRFLGFVRTLLPTMAGISGLNSSRFQVFNWLSAAIWVCALVGLGYAFSQIPLVKRYESQVMTGLMLLPLLLLFVGLLGAMLVIWRKARLLLSPAHYSAFSTNARLAGNLLTSVSTASRTFSGR